MTTSRRDFLAAAAMAAGAATAPDLSVFVFPDTSVYSLGDKPQHVYSVRFSARELWGDEAMPRDAVYIDMWDDYLEPA
jgi:hypothetical protein